MPLPTPSLDDRRFQDIVDEAKSLIPRFCPEWTDHNVSDPGIALIELFAWMTDLLLYRVNQIPDKMYVRFLEMIGVTLEQPRPARAPITFYLSAAQPNLLTVPAETEVATLRTETSPAIIFTTETELVIRPPALTGAFTRDIDGAGGSAWVGHDLQQFALPGKRLPMFPLNPAPGDAFYLSFAESHSDHVLALVVECETAGGAGVDPTQPPLEWQVWQGGAVRWAPCRVEFDGTLGFNQSGEIILHVPEMVYGVVQERSGFWLRCRLTPAQGGKNAYRVSPDIENLRVEARGGTVFARHATTVRNELLGQSEGAPGETYRLRNTPLLARDLKRDHLVVTTPGGDREDWQEVTDFADSGPRDRHYTLDSLDGTLTLGPSILQPDGSLYQFGAVPMKGSTLQFLRYQWGGGVSGNVPRGALSVLKSSIPYITKTINWQDAIGGRDAQSLEDAKLRAPQVLRTRSRAVTADDFAYLALQVQGVARAACLAPGSQPGRSDEPAPGQVAVVVVPDTVGRNAPITPEALTLSAELRAAVMAHLDSRRLIGTELVVRAPVYIFVSVRATIRLTEGSEADLIDQTQKRAESALYAYLNPLAGGPHGDGWPFGRDLHISELYGILHRIPAVQFIEEVVVRLDSEGSDLAPTTTRVATPPGGLICSGSHSVSAVA